MTLQELLEMHENTCNKARSIVSEKNHDCTDGSKEIFANFMASETLGVPAEIGILTRSIDEFQRIRSFVNQGGLKVKNESVFDAIDDVINYMILLKGIIVDRQEEDQEEDQEELDEKWDVFWNEVCDKINGKHYTTIPNSVGDSETEKDPAPPNETCTANFDPHWVIMSSFLTFPYNSAQNFLLKNIGSNE